MSCESHREQLIGVLEGAVTPEAAASAVAHLGECLTCRTEMEQYRALRQRLAASARMVPASALEDGVMARIAPTRAAASRAASPWAWLGRVSPGGRTWRFAAATAGLVALAAVVFILLLREPTPAWSIEQSIQATRQFRALRLRGTFGGNARCELWVRSSEDHGRSQRLLIRIQGGPTIWTEGNATHYYDPGSRVVYTDDAQTAGFNPWPGPRLFEMAQAAGVRMVDTRMRFPTWRCVVVEWSLLPNRGPSSARAEFDLDTKLLVSLTQWDNMDRRGTPGFEAHDIEYLADLPDEVFAVTLPPEARYEPKPVEVAEAVLGALAMPDAGITTPDLPLGEAARRVVAAMWESVLKRDVAGFKRLCPITHGWSDQFLAVILGGSGDPDAVVEVFEVQPGVLRGHSRLGPVSVVTSRVRHGDGKLYEEKTIVQHRLTDPVPSCVVYSGYGQPYRLD